MSGSNTIRIAVMPGDGIGPEVISVAVSVLERLARRHGLELVSETLTAGAFAYLLAEGLVLLTVGLLLSTRLSALATGVVAVALFGAAWLAGVVGALGANFHISALREVDSVARYVLPTDGLWHGTIYALEPPTILVNAIGHDTPFYAAAPPSWAYLVWCAVWVAAALAVAVRAVAGLCPRARIPRWARTPPLTRRSVLRRDEGRCAYCREAADTIDHVVPRSRGGRHEWTNVVASCKRDNLAKGDQLLSEIGWSLSFTPWAPDGHLWRPRHLADIDPLWEPYLAAAS